MKCPIPRRTPTHPPWREEVGLSSILLDAEIRILSGQQDLNSKGKGVPVLHTACSDAIARNVAVVVLARVANTNCHKAASVIEKPGVNCGTAERRLVCVMRTATIRRGIGTTIHRRRIRSAACWAPNLDNCSWTRHARAMQASRCDASAQGQWSNKHGTLTRTLTRTHRGRTSRPVRTLP